MIVVGITGSIGMGKSTAADMLREMGIPIHDSDATVHRLLGPGGRAVPPVARKFPEAVRKSEAGEQYIDRQVLGRIVFSDRKKKKDLESILHPLVREESDLFKEEMSKKAHPVVALDIPLLFETGGEERVDVTLCITAPPEVQRERVLSRHGMTSEKFDRIVSGQLPDAEKRRRADFVVDTAGGLEDTRKQLKQIVNKLLAAGKYA